jgi:glutathione S-transferase
LQKISVDSDSFSDQAFSIINKMTALQKEEINQLPKLVYYNIRGLGQPIRNLLYYFNIQFEDVRLERDLLDQSEQLESTFNSGLPKFQDDEITISDCVAIPIHLCQKFNHQELIGYTPRTKVKDFLF